MHENEWLIKEVIEWILDFFTCLLASFFGEIPYYFLLAFQLDKMDAPGDKKEKEVGIVIMANRPMTSRYQELKENLVIIVEESSDFI